MRAQERKEEIESEYAMYGEDAHEAFAADRKIAIQNLLNVVEERQHKYNLTKNMF